MDSLSPSKGPSSTNKHPTKAGLRSFIRREPILDSSGSGSPITPYKLSDQTHRLIPSRNRANNTGKDPINSKVTTNDIWRKEGSSSEDIAAELHSPSGSWRPRWLRRRVFFAFAVWFVALAVVLEPLLSLSQRASGIATTKENLYYLWTFGPTASELDFFINRILPCQLANSC
jgi:hypothetical protein